MKNPTVPGVHVGVPRGPDQIIQRLADLIIERDEMVRRETEVSRTLEGVREGLAKQNNVIDSLYKELAGVMQSPDEQAR